MAVQQPTASDTKLQDRLCSLFASISATLSNDFLTPTLSISTDDVSTTATTLSTHLTHIASRRFETPLSADKLSFHILRSRNEAEAIIDFDSRPPKVLSKGQKEWYYLALSHTSEDGDVQILVEGGLRKNKGEVLDAFIETIQRSLEARDEWSGNADEDAMVQAKENNCAKLLLEVRRKEGVEKRKKKVAEKRKKVAVGKGRKERA